MEYPLRNELQGPRRESFFDGRVFGGRAREAVLELVVKVGKLGACGVCVSGIGKGFLDQGKIRFGRDLKIFFAVESENRSLERLQGGERIVVEEKTEPGRTEHAQLCFQNGGRGCGGKTGFLSPGLWF